MEVHRQSRSSMAENRITGSSLQGLPKNAPQERISIQLSFTQRSSPRKLSWSERKRPTPIKQKSFDDPLLPSHVSVLSTPEEKELQKGESGKGSLNQTFSLPNSSSYEPKGQLIGQRPTHTGSDKKALGFLPRYLPPRNRNGKFCINNFVIY